jgi:hypothetical protein
MVLRHFVESHLIKLNNRRLIFFSIDSTFSKVDFRIRGITVRTISV